MIGKKAFEKQVSKMQFMQKVPLKMFQNEFEDARFSAIVYKPSDVPNASSPNCRSRTGEILESHINCIIM